MYQIVLFFSIIFFITNSCFAINVDDAIDIAIANSLEIQIETKKTEYTSLSKFEAVGDFLPNASLNYRNGTRRTEINSLRDKQKDQVKTLNITQPLFNGFSGVSRYRESSYQTRSAEQNLKFRKNEIALKIVDSYFNIFKYQQLNSLDNILIEKYKKLIALANKRLSLKDITYDEFSAYELKAKKNEIELNQNQIFLASYVAIFKHLTNQAPVELSYPQKPELLKINDIKDVSDFVDMAIKRNPKIKSTSFSSQAKKSALIAESGKLLPKISINYQSETQKSSYYFNGQDLHNKTIYLNFSIPIFQSGIEYSGILKANKENQIANLEKQLSIKEIERDAMEQHQKFLSLNQSLLSAESAFETSLKSLNLAKNRFNKKDIGLMEYISQQIDNIEIQKQMIAIKSDYTISYYNLKFLIDEINPEK
jgi:outer membrane protein TolC